MACCCRLCKSAAECSCALRRSSSTLDERDSVEKLLAELKAALRSRLFMANRLG